MINRSLSNALAALVPFTIAAQPSFVNTYGTLMAQHGVGVAEITSGYKTAAGVFREPGSQTGELWTFSNTGVATGQVNIAPPGQSFVQAAVGNAANEFFIAGSVIPPDADEHDALLVKLNASNGVAFSYAGSALHDQQYFDVAPLPDGGAIVCGTDNSGGTHDALVARISSTGTLTWSTTLPGALDVEANAVAISGNDVMITGRQVNFSGTSDCYFARLDLSGNVLWTTAWGGARNDWGEALVTTSTGKFVMAGRSNSYSMLDSSENRYRSYVYLIKIDLVGDTLWTAALGDTLHDRQAFSLDVASNGDLLIGGEREDLKLVDADVMRTDAAAHLLWEKAYDADRWDRLLDIGALSDGFVACGWSYGEFSRQMLLIRKDENGD